jgi:hypothetical protein
MYDVSGQKTLFLATKSGVTGITTTAVKESGITVGGNWTDNGHFTSGTGVVTLNGAAGQTVRTNGGGNMFNALNITNTTANGVTFSDALYANTLNAGTGVKKLLFSTTGSNTIYNSLNINGSAGNLITLAPATSSTNWSLQGPSTASGVNLSYVDVSYSQSYYPITANHSTQSGGHNSNWTVNP